MNNINILCHEEEKFRLFTIAETIYFLTGIHSVGILMPSVFSTGEVEKSLLRYFSTSVGEFQLEKQTASEFFNRLL